MHQHVCPTPSGPVRPPAGRTLHALRGSLPGALPVAAALAALLGSAVAPAASPGTVEDPEVRFVEVGAQRGLLLYRNESGQGSGLAAADFDDDGDVDVYVPQAAGRTDQLYVNDGSGRFTEQAVAHGLGRLPSGRSALWFDYDDDGDLDLVVATDDEDAPSVLCLYRQDAGRRFTDVTAAAGLAKPALIVLSPLRWSGLCAGDIDHDGLLDLYTAPFGGMASLFVNDGDGTFTDVSLSSGVTHEGDETFRHQAVMHDFDGDGWTDILVAVDFGPNELWLNQRNGTFVNAAPALVLDNAMNDMGIALGDYDNDGDFDVYITNIFVDWKYNVLYRNDSEPGLLRFSEVARDLGVADGRFGWGATWLDLDNDGDIDLATNNGYFTPGWTRDSSKFFRNRAAGVLPFVEEGLVVGYSDDTWGSALAAVDFDRDGDLDLMETCIQSTVTSSKLSLYDNRQGPDADANHWLIVRPRIDGRNRFAIGAVVRARAGDLRMMRLITAGTSYLTQEPAEAHFGAGAATHLDVAVEWPDGVVSEVEGVPVDQVITITRPAPPPVQAAPGAATFERVPLAWTISGLPQQPVTVERSEEGAAWIAIGQAMTDAAGTCRFEDRSISPGAVYRYRIAFRLQGTPFTLGEVGITVPASPLALVGAAPNPSRAGLGVRFSLADGSSAWLALYDVGGRLLRRLGVGHLGAGSHTLDLAAGLDLAPGLYWIRLEQAGRTLTRRAALVP